MGEKPLCFDPGARSVEAARETDESNRVLIWRRLLSAVMWTRAYKHNRPSGRVSLPYLNSIPNVAEIDIAETLR